MVCPIGGLQKCAKFGCSGDTFGGCWLLLILMIVSTQKYGQLVISLSYTSMVCRGKEMSLCCDLGHCYKLPKSGPNAVYWLPNAVFCCLPNAV